MKRFTRRDSTKLGAGMAAGAALLGSGRTFAQFATAEALTLLAHWLAEWRFRETGHVIRPAGMVTLRPADGLPLQLERR